MDRRVIWAIALMMVIAIGPTFFLKPPAKRPTPAATDTTAPVQPAPPPAVSAAPEAVAPEATPRFPAETLSVHSDLYDYEISTHGGAIVRATMEKYKALNPEDRGQTVQLLPEHGPIHTLALLVGQDTLSMADWDFVPSTDRRNLAVNGPTDVTLTATRGGVTVRVNYAFVPDDYQIRIRGKVEGLGPTGGHLLIGMGDGMRQTEADSAGNYYTYGIVTKTDESESHPFSKLKPGVLTTIDGPFEWVAVKAKYFGAALLAVDSGATQISGVTALAHPITSKQVSHADVTFGMPIQAAGDFSYRLYLGPLEYPRLRHVGHDFYDINPYGWPGFRTLIRPIAVGARWLLVWMHEHLGIAYGVVLILFGILIRIVLWPLNQKGMRASIRMQGLQPEMEKIQARHKDDPSKLQKEIMELYKREGVNPLSGCWPMLLPWPVLLALFFVLSNTIELRGQAFLWLPDLSLKDPLFIIPVLMGASMYGVNKVGMMGMPPNPQTKMMLYFLPVMMTVLFFNFASGLNLYYFVQNVVSIPQQWYLAKERIKAREAMGLKK